MYNCYHFSRLAIVIIFMLSFSHVHILCYYLCYRFMLSFLGCYHLCYHFMLSFFTVSKCYHFYVIISCYHFLRSANVIIFMLSFSLVHILCHHFFYPLLLSFIYHRNENICWLWKMITSNDNINDNTLIYNINDNTKYVQGKRIT